MTERTNWRKSSYSATTGACVEFAVLPDGTIGMRDSKDPDGPVLSFTKVEVKAMLDGAKDGEFDDLA